jgi:hypothetical protein
MKTFAVVINGIQVGWMKAVDEDDIYTRILNSSTILRGGGLTMNDGRKVYVHPENVVTVEIWESQKLPVQD